jgi:DNA-binding beta-propeller fold protein YncE
VAYDSADGSVYVTDSGANQVRRIGRNGRTTIVAGDSERGDADGTGTHARFFRPTGITYDSDHRVFYVVDSGNDRIRRVTPRGKVSTLVVRCVQSASVCWDADR